MTGYYKTPTNQPDPYNLRWVNIICDMLIPQRRLCWADGAMLMPVFLLIVPPIAQGQAPTRHPRGMMAIAGVMAGGMPLLHTHSFLALGLIEHRLLRRMRWSKRKKGERFHAYSSRTSYGSAASRCCWPRHSCLNLTFVQATGSDHFLRFQFNWCNNRGGNGLVEPYFWFYIKNIGIPYLMILLALFQRKSPRIQSAAAL